LSMHTQDRKIPLEDIVKLLSKIGVRLTPQRIIITKIILENVKKHPSFKELYELVRKEMPSIGISTLFNTLKLLEEHNVIRLFEYNGETHVDLPHQHINVYCINSKEIIDIEDNEINNIVEQIIKELNNKNIKIYRVNIIADALCNI
jgi:Fe2+ or Zn2+ uptake regulation protein